MFAGEPRLASLSEIMHEMHCQTHGNAHELHLNVQHEQPEAFSEDNLHLNESFEQNTESDRKLKFSQHSASFLLAPPLFTVLLLPTA